MITDYENFLKNSIFPDLEKGRQNWDKPHTETVVWYIKNILDNNQKLKLDRDVLIIAAYAHDWGYSGLFSKEEKLNYKNIADVRELHMKFSAIRLADLLKNKIFDFLSDDRKKRSIHLVEIHDNLKVIKDIDEIVLMEADTLATLDVSKVKPSFDKESNEKFMIEVKKTRYPKFVTDYGKQMFNQLFQLRSDYYAK
jgi:hypothetical protein